MLQGLCAGLLMFCGPVAAQTVALISDLNGRYGSSEYSERIDNAVATVIGLEPELVIVTGDMVAGQRQPPLSQGQLETMWSAFDQAVTLPLKKAGISMAVTAGNHDGSGFDQFELERQQFDKQWAAHPPEFDLLPGSQWPRRYAARKGEILLLGFDGTRPGALPDEELEFVRNMLRSYGTEAAITVVYSHLPFFPLATGREHEILDDPILLSVLHSNGVDVYASGHHHVFFAGTDDAGMLHLGVGALGGNARSFSGASESEQHSFAVLDFANGLIQVSSRTAPAFNDVVPLEELPAKIDGPLGTLRRISGPVQLRH